MIFKVLAFFIFFGTCQAFAETDFNKDVKPLIEKYCVSCHGPETAKAKLRMDLLDPDMINGKDGEMWQEALDLINTSDMPTKKAKLFPDKNERQLMIDWMTVSIRKALESERSTGGNSVMRRLTAYEYNNTMKDLLYVDLDFAKDLPAESVAKEGFANNNMVLSTSALHFEYFKKIAHSTLENIIMVPEEKPPVYRFKTELSFKLPNEVAENSKSNSKKPAKKQKKAKKPGNKTLIGFPVKMTQSISDYQGTAQLKPVVELHYGELVKDKGVILVGNRDIDKIDPFAADKKIGGSQGTGRTGYQPYMDIKIVDPPYTGLILVRVKAGAVMGKGETYPNMSLEFGSFRGAGYTQEKEFANIQIRASVENPKVYEFYVQAENYPIQANGSSKKHVTDLRIYNDFRRGTSKLKYEELPKLFIDSVEVTFNGGGVWPPAATRKILFESKNSDSEMVYLEEILKKFMPRAFRRQVTQAEVDKKIAFFKKVRSKESSFKRALVTTLTTVLCSPHFLMTVEPQAGENKRKLNDFELASRLSYFLWSSMPDNELFSLAIKKQLNKPEVMRAQIKRMMKSPKVKGFVENFTAQWLDTEGIQRVNVNPEHFSFNDEMKYHFADETVAFVDLVMNENLSIENFIDSDFAVVNNFMARHYRIPGAAGSGFVKIPLKDADHRGGLLTHASMLLANSTGADSHPIKRGVWILERMMDDPPPPPPAAVPELEEPKGEQVGKLSLKERLEKHAEVESCNGCHSKIDPWGVPFENYNALGQWREGSQDLYVKQEFRKVNVDPSSTLKNGKKISNLNHLKSFILNERKEKFVKAVIRKVMSYSFGRYVEFNDQKTVNAVYEKIKKNNFKFQDLVENVVLTEPFLTK